jgi:hypothetical protein
LTGVPLRWRIPSAVPAVKLTATALVLILGWLLAGGDGFQIVVALVAAAAFALWGVRDLIAPDRLTADDDGLTVIKGYAGRQHIPWPRVERIGLYRRSRLGVGSELLEIDTGDTLHMLGRLDLGAEPSEVAEALTRHFPERAP